ncbi:MAG: branched-chain amino acid ABC transporter permease [Rhodovulum sulfidophilum]|uniref:Branched-chain amino acid ABC transporter permease n=1 Tax=Rhodovulum sulfidophilum TaxID=35806 RepID=A0A2W5N4P5_RHOSU|nr:MAG: branched-chain amino acid ABC transporter permease [Rhodovulum sulfidophilum]
MSTITTSPPRAAEPLPRGEIATDHADGKALLIGAAVLAVLALAPLAIYPVFLMKALCFALFAAAFNLLLGYVGLLSFGHAVFFGGAAYITAHTAKVWGLTPELAILLGVAFAAALGLLIGALAIRRQGIYFAMVTLSLGQLVYFFFLQAPFTHGEDGIQSVPRGDLFGLISLEPTMNLYYFVLAVFALGMAFLWRVVHSPFGAILTAVRENEDRATSLGYSVARYKLAAFVISAAVAGLAGATKVFVFQLATLTDVGWQMSGEVILMTLLGGLGTFAGPAVGGAVILALQNYLAGSAVPITVVIGTIFVACVLLFRRGVVGEIIHHLGRRAGK